MIARALLVSLAGLATAGASAAACPEITENPVDIYPTAEVLPENLLRLYLYFPRPMAASEGLRHVRLLDAQGLAVNGVFLATNQELWSQDQSRLTVLLDPGRVKTGLAAHEAMGRALVPGQRYTLTVSGAALDAQGCALGSETTHGFVVSEPDYDIPNPGSWTLSQPLAGSTDALSVALGSTHDHLSMAYRLRVVDDTAERVPGAIALGPEETSWHFTPRQPWRHAEYALVIDERLEDLAGNRPGGLFDRPTSAAPTRWPDRLPFTPD